MLCFEEPETRTLWLAKATPRGWLAAGEAPIVAVNLTTRYGRVSYTMQAVAPADGAAFEVHANVTLPPTYADAATAPAGGVRLRLRAPAAYAGRLHRVTVGGEVAELHARVDRVHAREHRRAARRARRLAVVPVQPHARGREPVEVGRHVRDVGVVPADVRPAHVVD